MAASSEFFTDLFRASVVQCLDLKIVPHVTVWICCKVGIDPVSIVDFTEHIFHGEARAGREQLKYGELFEKLEHDAS